MRKLIYVLGLLLVLTGCSTSISTDDKGVVVPEEVEAIIDRDENAMYVDDDFKKVIIEINSLREKYKSSNDENDSNLLYIDIYNTNNVTVNFDNQMFGSKEYFDDLIEILDKSIAKGLKDHIKEVKDKEIGDNKVVLRKIGRVAIYAENAQEYMEDKENFIFIKINFSDLKDEYYSKLLDKVSADKYLLENMIIGDKLNMIDFVNIDNNYLSSDDYLSIRYNMYLKDKEIKKVNILMQGKNSLELEPEDIDVFVNLLNTLELKEEDKELLLNDYKDIFLTKSNNKKITLDSYKISINSNKGNTYSGADRKLVYFSIERI